MSFRSRTVAGLPRFVSVSALIAGIAGVLVAIYVPNAYDKTLPPLIILGALLGHYVHDSTIFEYNWRWLNRQWILIAYFFVAGTTVLAYVQTFSRTPVVNALLVGLYLLSAVGTLALESSWGKLLAPIGTAVLHRAFIYYASATQLGLDALFHNRTAGAISAMGTLDALSTSKYWYTSGYHLLAAVSTSVFGLGVRDAAFISVTLVMVFVVPIAIFAILQRDWGTNVAAFGAFLFLVAGQSVSDAVNTTPTTLGVIFFVLLLLFLDPYLSTGRMRYLGAIVVVLAGLGFTHQLSLFVALLTLGLYALAHTAWHGRTKKTVSRMLTFEGILLGTFLLQTFLTRYHGPRGESSTSFFMKVAPEVVNGFLTPFREGGGRTASFPPGYAVSGANSLTMVQVLGKAILFCFALIGAIYWLKRRRNGDNTVIGLGVMVTVVSLVVFGGGLVGTSVLLPSRWFAFLIIPLAILAAPGLLALVSKVSIQRKHLPTFLVVLLLVTTPYVIFMFGNEAASPDGPIFDTAPGAARTTTTATEAQLYQFIDAYAGDSTVVADHLAWQMIERQYGQSSRMYRTPYDERGTAFEGEQLIADREYASTRHVSFDVVYRGRPVRVFAPLPAPFTRDSVVYSTGKDRLIYRPSSLSETNV